MRKDRHHYIPIYYLKNFLNSDGHFHVYDKTNSYSATKPLYRSPKQICFEWDGNVMPSPDNKDNSKHIEDEYTKFDSDMALHLNQFLETIITECRVDWTQEFFNSLEIFVPNTYFRIPANTPLIERVFEDHNSINDFGLHVSNDSKFNSNAKLAKILYKEPNMKQQLRATLQYLAIKYPVDYYPDLEWRCYSTQGINQIGSDNPFQFLRKQKEFHHLRSEVMFPISPSLCLLRVPTFYENYTPITALLNLCLIQDAKQFVFSKDRESLKRHIKAYKKYLNSKFYKDDYLNKAVWSYTDPSATDRIANFLKYLYYSN